MLLYVRSPHSRLRSQATRNRVRRGRTVCLHVLCVMGRTVHQPLVPDSGKLRGFTDREMTIFVLSTKTFLETRGRSHIGQTTL